MADRVDVAKVHPVRAARISLLKSLPANSVGVEVGVYRGGFSRLIVKILNPSRLYLVDPWQWHKQWFVNHTNEELSLMAQGQNTPEGDTIYEEVKSIFADTPAVSLMRMTSIEASRSFPDNCFDWVFIDGDHRYAPVVEDIRHWWPKVKPGGSLCGDDYNDTAENPANKLTSANGVRFAVDEFLEATNLRPEFFPQEGFGRSYFKIRKSA